MPRQSRDLERVNVFLPEKELKVLRLLAKKRGVPYSDFIREAVTLWLRREAGRLSKMPRE